MANVQKLVPRNANALQFALYEGTLPAAWLTLVPRDNVSVSDGISTQSYPDFGTAMGQITAIAPDGDRTVSISFSAYLIPGDVPFQTAHTAYKTRDMVAFREQAIARDGEETFVEVYAGFITQFNRTYNRDGVADVAITFTASEDITPAPTP